MNRTIKIISKSLISICMVLVITSCIQMNELTTPNPLTTIDFEENIKPLIEHEKQVVMELTQTSLATHIAKTEIPASSMSETGEIDSENDQTCMGLFSEFAYSGEMDNHSTIQQPVLPLTPWEEVIDFPRNSDNKETYYLALARQYDGEVEIWIDSYVKNKIIIFKPETQEQRVLSSDIIDYPGMAISPTFIQSDGTVWGQNYVYGDNNEILYDPYPPLSRYNEETQRFEIPKGMFTISLYQENMDYSKDPLIFLDKNDVFWVFSQHDGLYQYAIYTEKMNKVLQTLDLAFRNGVMDHQGGIYFNRPTLGWKIAGLSSGEILYFNPELRKLESLSTPEQDWPVVLGLFIDWRGRLWTDISGYRDTEGKWSLLHKNIGEYFGNILRGESWFVPSIETQTTDGRFWIQREYSYYNDGTAWYDPETEEGCWFTSYTSRIVEDAKNRLWFEADGKLYKYDLLP